MTTVVNARLPWALFLPLAGVTELGGIILLLSGRGIGWAAVLAPIIGFLTMRGPVRPRFEFTPEGVIFRRSGKSPLLPWDEIAAVALVKAGGRTVLAYRLKPGVAVMKQLPISALFKTQGCAACGQESSADNESKYTSIPPHAAFSSFLIFFRRS